jgi:hypothetical protein
MGGMVMNDKCMVQAMQFASSGPWYVFLCTGTGRNFSIIYLMLSPMSSFATRDFAAKLDVRPQVCGPVGPQQ